MKQSFHLLLAVSLALVVLPGQRLAAQSRIAGTLWSASEVLETLPAMPLRCIPPVVLSDAQGVAIIPGVIKVGLGLGGRFGEGVVLGRNPDGTWGNPVFISLAGGSVGWQLGIQSADVILVFKTRKCMERILQGKGKLTLGADVAVAAGPVGRQAEAATDPRLQAEIYSYSRSRGLFAGLALEGAAILNNNQANDTFRRAARPEDVMAAEKLKAQLCAMSGAPRAPIIYPTPPLVAPSPPLLAPPQPPPPPPNNGHGQ